MQSQIVFGSSVQQNRVPEVGNGEIFYPGESQGKASGFSVDEDLLSRHILLLGGPGCGKTNVFRCTVENLRRTMTKDDIAIIFDAKGEYYDWFWKPGDYIIGNGARFRGISRKWNIFDEILADGKERANRERIAMNAREIATALFAGRGSAERPFYRDAARDIFCGILMHFIRQAQMDPETWSKKLNNQSLTRAFKMFQAEDYISIFSCYANMRSMVSYIGDGTSDQALGVFAELNSMISDYFVGVLAENDARRSVSMRNAVRARGGRAIFLEYDQAAGETLEPVYRLMIDLALKEALSRADNGGNVYLIADEFRLLSKLNYIDDALNFGSDPGVKIMAGIQSIHQLYDVYGQEKGEALASGFGSLIAFHTNDDASRSYVTRRFGTNMQVYSYYDPDTNRHMQKERSGNTVEEWEQLELAPGEAFIGLGNEKPFLFHFTKYGQ